VVTTVERLGGYIDIMNTIFSSFSEGFWEFVGCFLAVFQPFSSCSSKLLQNIDQT